MLRKVINSENSTGVRLLGIPLTVKDIRYLTGFQVFPLQYHLEKD